MLCIIYVFIAIFGSMSMLFISYFLLFIIYCQEEADSAPPISAERSAECSTTGVNNAEMDNTDENSSNIDDNNVSHNASKNSEEECSLKCSEEELSSLLSAARYGTKVLVRVDINDNRNISGLNMNESVDINIDINVNNGTNKDVNLCDNNSASSSSDPTSFSSLHPGRPPGRRAGRPLDDRFVQWRAVSKRRHHLHERRPHHLRLHHPHRAARPAQPGDRRVHRRRQCPGGGREAPVDWRTAALQF